MNKINIYCLSLYNDDYNKIKSLGYIPVGLGKNNFEPSWLRDNTGDNISEKNSFYGEYTFHYWFWKNKLKEIDDNEWVGFCAYRRFWTNSINVHEIKNKSNFLKELPNEWKNNNVILGNNIYMDGWTNMKIIKHGLKSFLLNPHFFLSKNRNLKLHFDSFHGYGNLEKAMELLDTEDRLGFKKFMENQNYFNRGNMFICNSKKILNSYYSTVFKWLNRCESIFGFNNSTYGKTRIYAFLIERFSSYWFNKHSKVKIWPIAFFDINKDKDSS
jgi:hypothetical protein